MFFCVHFEENIFSSKHSAVLENTCSYADFTTTELKYETDTGLIGSSLLPVYFSSLLIIIALFGEIG
jgi:hypothetical protein